MPTLDDSFLNTLLLLGAVYGLIFSLVVIVRNPSPARAKFWLGVLVGLFALVLFDNWGIMVALEDTFPPFGYTFYRCISLIPLSVWFYVQGLTDTTIRIGWPERAAIVVVATEICILLLCAATQGEIMGEYFWTSGIYFDLTGIGLALVFMYKSIDRIRRYQQQLDNNYTYYEQRSLRWLGQLLVVLVILMGVWIPVVLVNAYVDVLDVSFMWIWSLMALTVFFVGIKGYWAPDIIHDFEMVPAHVGNRTAVSKTAISKFVGVRMPSDTTVVTSSEPSQDQSAEQRTEAPVSVQDNSLLQRLNDLMEQHLYRQPKLSVNDVARRLHASPRSVSSLINQYFGVTFSDYVNGYRVEEVKKRIQQGDTDTYTLLAIGLDAGFNSKSSFYHTFRHFTKMTPAQFRESSTQ